MKASTLVETLVASVIFLVMFAISLETIVRLAVRRDDDTVYVVAEGETARLFREYASAGERLPGTTVKEYDWGTITIAIGPCRDYPRLQVVDVSATLRSERKVISRRQVVEINYEL
ncbi:hypothetical protein FACS1894159_09840 [Bacteroidia bacterium]|nr:hypothetical protein FACS1894159_09840 [Bacteroidia bacterium]